MAADDAIKLGILKCRDLVELYYGARMVVTIRENLFSGEGSQQVLFGLDPRRIRYEVIISNGDAATQFVNVGTPQSLLNGTYQAYQVLPGDTIIVERDFFTDMDAVTYPLSLGGGVNANVSVSTRETFLTPAPVDEIP